MGDVIEVSTLTDLANGYRVFTHTTTPGPVLRLLERCEHCLAEQDATPDAVACEQCGAPVAFIAIGGDGAVITVTEAKHLGYWPISTR
jgi:hypothetical protein